MSIMKCPACGGQTDDSAPACPHCGKAVGFHPGVPAGSTVCRKCGILAPEGAACPVCGAKLSVDSPAAQSRKASILIAIAVAVLGLAVMVQSMLCTASGK